MPANAALVTGSGSGIGRAISIALAKAGVPIAVVAHRAESLPPVIDEIEAAGGRCVGYAVDVSDWGAVDRLVGQVEATIGPIDILVNCAGIYPRSSVADMAPGEWDRVLGVNLGGLFHCAHAVLPSMIERRRGRILAITSEIGRTGVARGAHYAASKAGIDAVIKSLAKEVGDYGITVNAIAPGLTDTPMMRGANSQEYIESVVRTMPGARLGQPDDCVNLALFLLSDGGLRVTGQVIGLRP